MKYLRSSLIKNYHEVIKKFFLKQIRYFIIIIIIEIREGMPNIKKKKSNIEVEYLIYIMQY